MLNALRFALFVVIASGFALALSPRHEALAIPPSLVITDGTPTPPPGAAPFVAQAATPCGTVGTAATITCSFATAPSSTGTNMMLAFLLVGNSASTVTPPSGWTLQTDVYGQACKYLNGSGSQGLYVYGRTVQAADPAGPYQFGLSPSDAMVESLVEVDGVSAATPIDRCYPSNANGSTGPVTGSLLTATAANELPLTGYAPSTSSLGVTLTSPWLAVSLYNNTQTPYATQSVQRGTTLAAAGTITAQTTFTGVTGSIVYVPIVPVLMAPTGTTIATPTPTPTPTAPPFQNGVEWATSFTPYASTSVWNHLLPASPTIWSGSAAVMNIQFNSTGVNYVPVRNNEAGNNDPGHPVYFASATDPLITINCRTYCDTTDNGGFVNNSTQIRIPAQAREAAPGCTGQSGCAGDHHLSVVQPDGLGNVGQGSEYDFYGVTAPTGDWGTAGNTTISAGAVQNCGSFISGSGIAPNGAVTVGGACVAAGLIRANELLAGRINHALFLVVNCAASASQNMYPVQNGAGTDVCTNYPGDAAPPLGAAYWLDYSDSYIAGLSLPPWAKAILYALHDYGGFVEDDNSGGADIQGLYFKVESGEMFYAFGQPDPFAGLAASPNSWTNAGIPTGSYTTRYIGADPWKPAGVDFLNHMHILDPCVARRTC